MIVIVFGLPGSGKSYFSLRLAEMLQADYVSSDKVRKSVFVSITYSTDEKLVVYDKLMSLMREAAIQSRNAVIDATFYKEGIREKFMKAATGLDDIVFIEVRAEEGVIKQRMQQLREDSEADFAVYEKIKEQWEPMEKLHLILESTDDNIIEMLEKAADYLHLLHDKRRD